jgi:hypothetical protein
MVLLWSMRLLLNIQCILGTACQWLHLLEHFAYSSPFSNEFLTVQRNVARVGSVWCAHAG